jgi:DNA polymerase
VAAAAADLAGLRAAIAAFPHCPLRDTATNLVFAAGDPAGGVLILGDAPGSEDDRAGIPLTGEDGILLDRMLAAIGLRREQLLLAPLVPWRPPGNRPPNAGEIAQCLPFLRRLISLTAPRVIVLLGTPAARAVLGEAAPRRTTTPAWIGEDPACLILPALAAVRGIPARKRDAWTGLRLLRRRLDQVRQDGA